MAGTIVVHPNGAGESLGNALITEKPLYTTGAVWYVNSSTGTDAASPAGKNRLKPLATLSQAHTNASAGDIIVLQSGHAETLTSAQTLSKAVSIVGAGLSSGKPTVKLTINASAASLFAVSGNDVELRNIWIEENAQANSSAKISVTGAGFRMIGCYVEADGNDDATCLSFGTGAQGARLEATTFISTSTDATAQPESAIKTAVETNDLELVNLTLDGGTVGWSNFNAFDASSNDVNRLRAVTVNLLNGADMNLGSSSGWLVLGTVTGGSLVEGLGDHYPNGIVGTGDALLTGKPVITSGDIWYVHATNGTDATLTAGQNRNKPLATLAQAITNSSSGDIIVCMDGHEETVTSAWALSKQLTIVGGGSSDGKPTAKLTLNAASSSMFTPSTTNVQLRNLWLEENAQSNTTVKVLVTGDYFRMVGCYVEGNGNDTSSLLTINNADNCRIEDTTFISTATATGSLPESAVVASGIMQDLEMEGVVMDGGVYGWDNYYAFANTGALTRLRAIGGSFLRGSDVSLSDSTTGWLTAPTTTGSVRIECAPGGA